MRYSPKERQAAIDRAMSCGLTYAHAVAVRRIALTLRRWYELECCDSNDECSWAIVRGKAPEWGVYFDTETQKYKWGRVGEFTYDDDGLPYMEKHYHNENTARYVRLADREQGALKRLNAIMAHYPDLRAYLQTDPRGGTLYLIRPGDVPEGKEVGAYYNRGVFVA